MNQTKHRPEGADGRTDEKSTDRRGRHPKRGLPGKLQVARATAPEWADDKMAQAVAFAAHRDGRHPADVWAEVPV